jgi:glycyl-tRNA synthetase
MNIKEMSTFCKKKGFVFQNSEIYGGLSGFFDYGPLGVELKNNIKENWWNCFVRKEENIFGIDGSILSHQNIWKASGHIENFEDILVEDKVTKERFRADHLVEEKLNIQVAGLNAKELGKLIKENKITSPKGNKLTEPKQFNLMFQTNIGPIQNKESISYLRPETAQSIFTNFKQVAETQRAKLPFGIAQIGKAFRNEISPREFLFRQREFEQMEVEFFLREDQQNNCPLLSKFKKTKIKFISANNTKAKIVTLETINATEWHKYWLIKSYNWFLDLGINKDNLRIREHSKKELSHYSSATFDIEYQFPFGWKEIHGNANRGNFDLKQHMKHSKEKLELYDEETKKKILPEVIEPSQGVDRAFLVFLYDSLIDDKKRGNIVLKLHSKLSPYKSAVFPLVSNKKDIMKLAKKVYSTLEVNSFFDKSGSIGRRYARQDEIGTPFCITIDFDSIKDKSVTVRDRNTTRQKRIKISKLNQYLRDKL